MSQRRRRRLPHLHPAAHSDRGRPVLGQLVHRLPIRGDGRTTIERLTWRSDESAAGALFFCVPFLGVTEMEAGARAVASGAAALVVSDWLPLPVPQVRAGAPVKIVRSMGPIAAEFYGRPADGLVVAGVTGTNGKTTVTYLLESIFSAAGLTPGIMGSTGVWFDRRQIHQPWRTNTTPEAPVVQERLRELLDAGASAVAMEATSHALDQHRLEGLRFSTAIFTNLTHEHLDYHGTMDRYFRAKARLFEPGVTECSVLNADDPEARRLRRRRVPALTFGIRNEADVRATDVRLSPEGVSFRVGRLELRSPLVGRFNLSNCLAAVAAARSLDLDDRSIAEGLATVRRPAGRMDPIDVGQEFLLFVDYAHTPDGLVNALEALRPVTRGRILLVMGCGGDRDRGKRPVMAEIGTTLADLLVITTNDPRSEDPEAIAAEMEPGAAPGRYVVELDRRAAIALAVRQAEPGDTVLIAGRGPETALDFGERMVPFDDRVVAAEELGSRGAGL